MKALPIIGALVILAFASQQTQAEAEGHEEAAERLAQIQARLNLSDDQLDRMAPILEESQANRRVILARYGINLDNRGGSSKRPGFRQMRAMRGELEGIRAETLAELEDILTREQLAKFKLMLEEQRAEIRERLRRRLSAE